MNILFSTLSFILGYICGALSSHNLTETIIFDISFARKLFKTPFIKSKTLLITGVIFSLCFHAAILVGGFFLSRLLNAETLYCIGGALVWLRYAFFSGRFHTQNMLGEFFDKYQSSIDITLTYMVINDDFGLITNYKDIMDTVDAFSMF